MKKRATILVVLLSVQMGLAAPADSEPNQRERRPKQFTACTHPFPCGDEWPKQLEDASFELKEVIHLQVPSHDGTILNGWVGLPDLPPGVRAPVVLHSTPYIEDCYSGGCDPSPADVDEWWSEEPHPWATSGWGMKPLDLVQMGYAAAYFSVRGTGRSGGCFELYGRDQEVDQALLVEYLAKQPWANGRVAMAGNSFPAGTAAQAAVGDPAPGDGINQVGAPSLKTIVISGILSDLYTLTYSPQGLYWPVYALNRVHNAGSTLLPPLTNKPSPDRIASYAGVAPERVCTRVVESITQGSEGHGLDTRSNDYYEPRRLVDRFPQVTSSVLLAQGFGDYGHRFQDSIVWKALGNAPKRQLTGTWGHSLPSEEHANPARGPYVFDASWTLNSWQRILSRWLAFWLKGEGVHPGNNHLPEDLRLDTVDYQDSTTQTWRSSTAWPPTEARDEVLYLSDDALDPHGGGPSRSFRSAPTIANSYKGAQIQRSPWQPWEALCSSGMSDSTRTGVVYFSEHVEKSLVIAGNPFLYLRLTSTEPGGAIAAALADVGPEFSCDAAMQPSDIRWLTNGGADLRFHQGNLNGEDFPVGEPTAVRIDLADVAATIEPGHRLALILSFGEPHVEAWTQPYYPNITVGADGGGGASHLVLPMVGGTLGGDPPHLVYPPRPFSPQ